MHSGYAQYPYIQPQFSLPFDLCVMMLVQNEKIAVAKNVLSVLISSAEFQHLFYPRYLRSVGRDQNAVSLYRTITCVLVTLTLLTSNPNFRYLLTSALGYLSRMRKSQW